MQQQETKIRIIMKPLFIIIGFLFCTSIWAGEITLYCENSKTKRVEDKRSLSLEPTASLNEKTLCIYTNMPVENLQIEVTDGYNNTVYSANDITYSRSHNFDLSGLSEGEYTVELTIGDEYFYGYFSIP